MTEKTPRTANEVQLAGSERRSGSDGVMPRVAYQGEEGAYSEIAARQSQALPALRGASVTPMPCPSFTAVFEAVTTGAAEYGVVPVENSLAGAVHQNVDLLLDSDLHVAGEVIVRVAHCLLGAPGGRLEDIRRAYSHPQALAQCQGSLERLGITPVAVYDTAGAAKQLAIRPEPDAAAIASSRAGEIYGLQVLAENIEDEPFNFTRFFLLSRREAPPRADGEEPRKTSIVFASRHQPGALLSCLAELANLNLTRIESRPRRDRAWSYLFTVDFEGDARDPAPSAALAGLLRKAAFVKVLGSFPRAAEGA